MAPFVRTGGSRHPGQAAPPHRNIHLNSANIISNIDCEKELIPFHNTTLTSNPSQSKSVELAFREKNIFLIQGPPGTGKTTVIRELVEQVLGTDDYSRILIVLRVFRRKYWRVLL